MSNLTPCPPNVDISFLFRGSASDGVRFAARVVAERIKVGEFSVTSGEFGGKTFMIASFVDRETGLVPAAVATSDYKHPKLLFELLRQTLAKFKATNWYGKNKGALSTITEDAPIGEATADFAALLRTYQTPEKIDKIAKIMKEIDDTYEIMMQNLDHVLRRGERLEDLLDKTKEISVAAKGFARRSEKLNDRCCNIL
jgi:synaptobrevin homolog YKT6